MAAQSDLLDIVESAYDVDAPPEEWLSNLASTVRPHLDGGFGVAAFEYWRPAGEPPQIVRRCYLGIPSALAEIYPRIFATMDPEVRERPFRLGPCVAGSQMMNMRQEFAEQPHMKRFAQTFGMYDSLWITAAEPSGHGCGFHAGRSQIAWATRREVGRWGRIAAHLSTALRLRHRLKEASQTRTAVAPEAVLDPRGKVHEASGPASMGAARDLLKRAVLALERARGPIRRRDPDASLDSWRALVAGRWSLVDLVEHNGRRFVVARENEPTASGLSSLSAREKQVIAYARLGHHTKLIAYELGIADSTVRVLLARAASKLGAHSREELLRKAAVG